MSVYIRILLLAIGLLSAPLQSHGSVSLVAPPEKPLGRSLLVVEEREQRLDPSEVLELVDSDAMLPVGQPVPAFGIGAAPSWFYLSLNNPTDQTQTAVLLAGATWLDRIDFFVLAEGEVRVHQVAGDQDPDFMRPIAGVGYRFEYGFPPGDSIVLLRVETPDPMLVPIRLVDEAGAESLVIAGQYSYGLLYGFLFALLSYNLMLYVGLRQRSHLYYSIYLAAFIGMNVAYTGHGYVWLWPDSQALQQYVILVLMVLFACSGFRFARVFLDLDSLSPRIDRVVSWLCLPVVGLMAVLVIIGAQASAAYVAFAFMLFFTFAMVGLGFIAVAHKSQAGRYFLAAVISGMIGIALTTLTVWGWIPYHTLGFRAVEIGIAIEATLLALAVAYLVRQHEEARLRAEAEARTDALTGLMNRRAFWEQGNGMWNTASRHGRPLSVILLDIDHFKSVNDRFGHAAGDKVLIEAAKLIRQVCRQGDLAARWGGEEFIIMLPESSQEQAHIVAERLREKFATREVWITGLFIELSASFGVVARDNEGSLESLIAEADTLLYRAKHQGRDRVCVPELA